MYLRALACMQVVCPQACRCCHPQALSACMPNYLFGISNKPGLPVTSDSCMHECTTHVHPLPCIFRACSMHDCLLFLCPASSASPIHACFYWYAYIVMQAFSMANCLSSMKPGHQLNKRLPACTPDNLCNLRMRLSTTVMRKCKCSLGINAAHHLSVQVYNCKLATSPKCLPNVYTGYMPMAFWRCQLAAQLRICNHVRFCLQ